MTRTRGGSDEPPRRSRPGTAPPARRTRYPAGTDSETPVELGEEEVRALLDEGVDPEDLERVARQRREREPVSDHDRDTPRDEVEGLVLGDDETDT